MENHLPPAVEDGNLKITHLFCLSLFDEEAVIQSVSIGGDGIRNKNEENRSKDVVYDLRVFDKIIDIPCDESSSDRFFAYM